MWHLWRWLKIKADVVCKDVSYRLLGVLVVVVVVFSIIFLLPLSIYAQEPPPTKTPFLTDGPNQTVDEGEEVTLEGRIWINGTYSWNQIDGIPVQLSNPATARPTFTAPQADTQTVLTFQYRVIFEDGSSTNLATMRVTVMPIEPLSELPDTTIIAAVDRDGSLIQAETLSSYVEFTFTGEDDIYNPSDLRFECSLDGIVGDDFQLCESPEEYADLHYGNHEFQVRAIDEEGNADPNPARYVWTVNEPPNPVESVIAVHIDKSSPYTNDDQITITGTVDGIVTDELVSIRILDPNNMAFYSSTEIPVDPSSGLYSLSPISLESASEGRYIVQAEYNNANDETEFTVGPFVTPAPDTEITSVIDDNDVSLREVASEPTSESTYISFEFEGASSDNSDTIISGFECSLDRSMFSSCTNPQTYDNLKAGSVHTFEVRAVEGGGRVDPTPASFTWRITSSNGLEIPWWIIIVTSVAVATGVIIMRHKIRKPSKNLYVPSQMKEESSEYSIGTVTVDVEGDIE
jgi:hypothetical protein